MGIYIYWIFSADIQNNTVISVSPLLNIFCRYYSRLAGEENAAKYKTAIFLAASASAEFFAVS